MLTIIAAICGIIYLVYGFVIAGLIDAAAILDGARPTRREERNFIIRTALFWPVAVLIVAYHILRSWSK